MFLYTGTNLVYWEWGKDYGNKFEINSTYHLKIFSKFTKTCLQQTCTVCFKDK